MRGGSRRVPLEAFVGRFSAMAIVNGTTKARQSAQRNDQAKRLRVSAVRLSALLDF